MDGHIKPKVYQNLIKRCYHFVASHEQRQCFALDSIRYPDGSYPVNAVEVIYPGMHSDVGGGYPINDQGKARDDGGEILSQIVLHDLYVAAIESGAPLAIHPDYLLTESKNNYSYRVMSFQSINEFAITKELAIRFNAWRKTISGATVIPTKNNQIYTPLRFKFSSIEDAIEEQMGWMTAWRIARYASERQDPMNLSNQPFFQASTYPDGVQVPPWDKQFPEKAEYYINEAKYLHEKKLKNIQHIREIEKTRHSDDWIPPLEFIGEPLFDEKNGRGQLWEASCEFKMDYDNVPSVDYFNVTKKIMLYRNIDRTARKATYLILGHEPDIEYDRLKQLATLIYEDTIKPVLDKKYNDPRVKNVFSTIEQVISLYDNQIHDSRAWFMHTEIGMSEMLGDYFLFRMIYFGHTWNKLTQVINLDLELQPNIFEFDLSKNVNDIQIIKHHNDYILKSNKRTTEYIIPKDQISSPTPDFLSEIGKLETVNINKRNENIKEYISTLPNIIKLT